MNCVGIRELTNIAEEPAASIFTAEDAGCRFIQKNFIKYQTTQCHISESWSHNIYYHDKLLSHAEESVWTISNLMVWLKFRDMILNTCYNIHKNCAVFPVCCSLYISVWDCLSKCLVCPLLYRFSSDVFMAEVICNWLRNDKIVTMVTNFHTAAPNFCGSLLWNLALCHPCT